jgi:hypothetical protein
VAPLKITPSVPVTTEPEQAIDASFDNRFRLLGFSNVPETIEPGGAIGLELLWQADDPDGRDYTVFIHLMDAAGEVVAQADAPPRQGRYPTSIWEAGERVIDLKIIDIPPDAVPGEYTILSGLYDPATGVRLPAYGADGSRYANDAAVLTSIRIVE